MSLQKQFFITLRVSEEEKKDYEKDAQRMNLSISDYIKHNIRKNKNAIVQAKDLIDPLKSAFQSLKFLEENYKDLSRMIMATQIGVDNIASKVLEKKQYENIQRLYRKAFDLYDVAKKGTVKETS